MRLGAARVKRGLAHRHDVWPCKVAVSARLFALQGPHQRTLVPDDAAGLVKEHAERPLHWLVSKLRFIRKGLGRERHRRGGEKVDLAAVRKCGFAGNFVAETGEQLVQVQLPESSIKLQVVPTAESPKDAILQARAETGKPLIHSSTRHLKLRSRRPVQVGELRLPVTPGAQVVASCAVEHHSLSLSSSRAFRTPGAGLEVR